MVESDTSRMQKEQAEPALEVQTKKRGVGKADILSWQRLKDSSSWTSNMPRGAVQAPLVDPQRRQDVLVHRPIVSREMAKAQPGQVLRGPHDAAQRHTAPTPEAPVAE